MNLIKIKLPLLENTESINLYQILSIMKKLFLQLLIGFSLIINQQYSNAQTKTDTPKYSIKKVTKNVYIFTEMWKHHNNGNMGVVIGEKGVLIINTLMLSSAKTLEAEIRKITNLPIKYVINSDSDLFNYHANDYFKNKGAQIISHKNLKYATPNTEVLFTNELSFAFGDEFITAYHTKAHTLDHIDIHLKKSNVLFMGDGFKGHWLTYVGPNGTKGVVEGINRALSLSNEKTIIVSGNTSKNEKYFLNHKSDLIKNRKIYLNFSKRIGELHKNGFTIKEISKDKKIHQITSSLEAYSKFNKYLNAFIAHIIEVDFTKAFTLSKKQLLAYTGIYNLGSERQIEVVFENKKLIAREKGVFIFELAAVSTTKFDFKGNTGFRGTSNREDYLEFQFSTKGDIISLKPILKKDNLWYQVLSTGTYVKQKTK